MTKRRRHKAGKKAAPVAKPVNPVDVQEIERPTPERMRRGIWAIGTRKAPVIDLASDMIGELFATEQITSSHHEAARLFQEIVAAYQADLGLRSYRSCLDDSTGGHDAGDGDPRAVQRYDDLKRRLGPVRFVYLRSELDKPAGAICRDLDVLKKSLDRLAEAF